MMYVNDIDSRTGSSEKRNRITRVAVVAIRQIDTMSVLMPYQHQHPTIS